MPAKSGTRKPWRMSQTSFRIATWNINSVRLRIEQVVRFLDEHKPDVLCLQETKCREEEFPAKAIRTAGYEHMAVHGQKAYHGSAIVSRLPIDEVERIDFCGMGDARHVAVTATLPSSIGGQSKVRVHSLYVPAGGDEPNVETNPKFDHKLRFVAEMEKRLQADSLLPTLIAGDLNIAPYEEDVWSHKQLLKVVSHTPVETELFEKTRQALGYTDTMRRHIPFEESSTHGGAIALRTGRRPIADAVWITSGPVQNGLRVLPPCPCSLMHAVGKRRPITLRSSSTTVDV